MDAPKFRTKPKVHEPKGLFFGKSGTGKTSVSLSTGKPTVLINTDNGAEEILSQQKKADIHRSRLARHGIATEATAMYD